MTGKRWTAKPITGRRTPKAPPEPKLCPRCLNIAFRVEDGWACPKHGVLPVERQP